MTKRRQIPDKRCLHLLLARERRWKRGFILFCCWVIVLLNGQKFCESSPVTRAFYHWKTIYTLSSADLEFLRELGIQKLYVKFFDVDWFDDAPRGAFPVAPLCFQAPLPEDMELVPTVFLTNEVVRRIRKEELPTLAEQITRKIQRMAKAVDLPPLREIQLDCDWSGATRVAYFTLLQEVSDLMQPQQIAVSATIRLHQIKFAEDMGTPPVTRGMLMCYNMHSPKQPNAQNAIFDLPLIKDYLGQLEEYTLPLDAALPLFSWAAVYRRERFIMLINNARTEDLILRPEFDRDRDGMFLANEDTLVNGLNVFRGERLRVDEVLPEGIQDLARFLAPRMTKRPMSVALFHYDPALLKYYELHDLKQTYRSFKTATP